MLAEVSPTASRLLAEIQYASVAQVSVEFEEHAVTPHLDASGILFPRVDGMVLTACTWFSTKWAHYQRPGRVLLRLTSGRFGDTRALALDDDALVKELLSEVQCVLDITAEPTALRVHRWIDALPQYVPGHAERVEAICNSMPMVRRCSAARSMHPTQARSSAPGARTSRRRLRAVGEEMGALSRSPIAS